MPKMSYGKYIQEYREVAVKLITVECLAVDAAAFRFL